MEYISIIKSDVDLLKEHHYLRLPHPRTSQAQLYLPSVSNGREVILEVVRVQCSRRRTWFVGDNTIDAGTILVHYQIDPLFLAIPVLLHLINAAQNSSSPPPFQPLSDLVSCASASPVWALVPPFTKAAAWDKGGKEYNADVPRLLGCKSVRRAFKLGCEKKVLSGAPPSPSGEHSTSKQVYYRPSLSRILALLQKKVEHLAEPERIEQFDLFVRTLSRDGMLAQGTSEDLLKAARIKAVCEHMGQWLPPTVLAALLCQYDFSTLSEYLANRAAASAAVAAPVVKATKEGAKAGTKRKAPPASRGVEALKKVNTSSMAKMTSFFKPKDGAMK